MTCQMLGILKSGVSTKTQQMVSLWKRTTSSKSAEADALRADHMGRSKKEFLTTPVLRESMQNLHSDTVYMSTVNSMPTGESATVSADKKRLTLYQYKMMEPTKHVFPLTKLQKWVDAVKPEELHNIYVMHWAEDAAWGLRVDQLADDDAVSQALFGEAGRFKSYIIRAGIFPNVPPVKLSGRRW